MKLESLELANFKNYQAVALRFDGKFVCFTGKNGQGKTNLLDAMYYLSLTKSFLQPWDNANIRHDQGFFRIAGSYITDDQGLHSVVCLQERNQRKKIIVNDKTVERFADHIGEFPLVIISPADFDLFTSAEERRKFIDNTISQFDKTYLDHLIHYNRVLSQRNSLLKDIQDHKSDKSLLESYDFHLDAHASPVHALREEFLQGFLPYFESFYKEIAGAAEVVEIHYESDLNSSTMTELLARNKNRDIALGHTSSGIHREDFNFLINGFQARRFGSQGQQKSFLIALKLAKHRYIGFKKNKKPLLLIDDLHDKLDSSRVEQLFSLLNTPEFEQVFITDTQKQRLDPLMKSIKKHSSFFSIEKGAAIPIRS